MKKFIYLFTSAFCLTAIFSTAHAQGQGTNFSMYQYAPTLNNAAMLGSSDELIVKYGYRNQQLPNGQAFNTNMLTVGCPIYFGANKHSRLTLGGSVMLDNQTKFFKTTGVILNASYTVRLNERNYLGAGFQTGFAQRGVKLNGTTENQYNPLTGNFDASQGLNEQIDGQTKGFGSLDAGLYWTMRDAMGDDKIFAGISAHGFNSPNVSLVGDAKDKMATRIVTIAGITVYHKNHISIIPNLRLMNQAGNTNLNIGTWVRYGIGSIHPETKRKHGNIGVGLWYNIDGALVTSLELNQPKYFVSVAYNASLNNDISTIQGAGIVEFCVGFKIRKKDKVIIQETGTEPQP